MSNADDVTNQIIRAITSGNTDQIHAISELLISVSSDVPPQYYPQLKAIEEAGIGTLIQGRGINKTTFSWASSLKKALLSRTPKRF